MKKQKDLKKTIEPMIGITAKNRKISTDILNTVLANEFVLLVETLNYHWNLVGPQFNDYHLLFDKQYTFIFKSIDAIAERVRAVGGIALGSMKEFLAHTQIKETTGAIPTPQQMVFNLLTHHEVLIRHLREGINTTAEKNRDMGTNNFLTDLLEEHEKIAWILRSLLERS